MTNADLKYAAWNGSAWEIQTVESDGSVGFDFTVSDGTATSSTATFDIAIAAGDTDTDGDGMPDQWEIAHQFNRQDATDASQDSDGGRLSNLQEYLAGTHPRDAASALRVLDIELVNSDIRLSFATIFGRKSGRANVQLGRRCLGSHRSRCARHRNRCAGHRSQRCLSAEQILSRPPYSLKKGLAVRSGPNAFQLRKCQCHDDRN